MPIHTPQPAKRGIHLPPQRTQNIATGQRGDGFFDSAASLFGKAKAAYEAAKPYVSAVSDAYGSELATQVKNLIPSSDDTGRPSFPGEKHAILKLPNGKYGIANYVGQPWAPVSESAPMLVC